MASIMHLSPDDHHGIAWNFTGFGKFLNHYQNIPWLQDGGRAIAMYLNVTEHEAIIPQKIVERLTQIHSSWLYSLYDGLTGEVH